MPQAKARANGACRSGKPTRDVTGLTLGGAAPRAGPATNPYEAVYAASGADGDDVTHDLLSTKPREGVVALGNNGLKAEIITPISDNDTGQKADEAEWGIGPCRPQSMVCCGRIRIFTLVCCVQAVISGMLIGGYINSVITTIEKRFEIGSAYSGLVAASVELGCVSVVTFASYLGTQRHIPKFIGVGTIVMGIGSLLFSLPHWMAERYTIRSGLDQNVTTEDSLCITDRSGLEENCVGARSGNGLYIFILVIAQMLIGGGGSPLYTLGTTYIDDHVTKDKAPAYIACVYAAGALGPVLGFGLGALVLQVYVDVFALDQLPEKLHVGHPQWVGAWWTGFLFTGFLLLCNAMWFFGFPKALKKEKDRVIEDKAEQIDNKVLDEDALERKRNYGRRLRDLPRDLVRLWRNPIYSITNLGICCEICIVQGFVVFLPKFLETQFGLDTTMANLLTGGIAIPGAIVGILLGGFALKKFHMRAKAALQFVLVLNLLALGGFATIFFLGCQNVKMAGATLPYTNTSGHSIFAANLTSPCNAKCACSPNDIEPICGVNGITYFSPCHAGCTQFYGASALGAAFTANYSDCACILGQIAIPSEVIMAPMATSGRCRNTCNSLLPFMILLFFMTLLVAATHTPLLMVTMRNVKEEERAFALGMQFVIIRLLGYIPAPIIFGSIIDTACLLWRENCGGSTGVCLLYDIEQFRYKYIGIGCGFKLLGSIIFIIVWLLICRRTDTQLVTMEPENRLLRLCFQTADDRPQTNSLNGSEVTTETHL